MLAGLLNFNTINGQYSLLGRAASYTYSYSLITHEEEEEEEVSHLSYRLELEL